MRIAHLCLACFFPDGFSYQENMLPKFHRRAGHEVTVIASLQSYDSNGKVIYLEGASVYQNEHDVTVQRLDYAPPLRLSKKLKHFRGLTEALQSADPELLFIHGCQFLDMGSVVRYVKKHPGLPVFVDNHADFGNSAKNWFSLHVLHKLLWKHCARRIAPYAQVFYGVTPSRVEFLQQVYRLPEEKTELLVMGADDDMVKAALRPQVRKQIRESWNVPDDAFLIVTGGKINRLKRSTVQLMQAVRQMQDPHVRLLVFGSVIPELKQQVMAEVGEFVGFVGWIPSEEAYSYFAAADLVAFPGSHSVLWEQAAGLGKPLLCSRWPGSSHLDIGGNIRYLDGESAEEIQSAITELVRDPVGFERMKQAAEGKGRRTFSYEDIAKRSIELR